MRFKHRLLSILFSLLWLSFGVSWAEPLDLLHSIPLEIKDYEVSKEFPVTFYTAEQVLKAIDSSPVLIIHMEALRRGHEDLPDAEKQKLLAALQKRHQQHEKDLQLGFDHGYAQLVYANNKTGLFFLRKANDQFQNQFSSLAYAMAQIEADLNHEGAAPDAMTTRKMDVMYKLSDAVKFDAANHQPGFWPTFVRVIDKIKAMPAYESFARRDFSLVYLPYGSSVVPMQNAQIVMMPLNTNPEVLAANAKNTSCDPGDTATSAVSMAASALPDEQETPEAIKKQKPATTRPAAVKDSGHAVIQFFPTETPGLHRVRVTGTYGEPMLSFETYASNRIVEDLEGDGSYEIVARQYAQNPLNPILVYRYTPCGFELDKKVFNSFR